MSEVLDTQLATKGDIVRLDGRISLIQWMIVFNLASTMAMLSPALKILRSSRLMFAPTNA